MPRLADHLAERVHARETDKAGRPYVGHPRRVAAKIDDPLGKVVALLHDVLEDSKVFSESQLRSWFGDEVVDAVVALTKVHGEAPDDYYERVRQNELARRVKLADISDNLDPERVALLEPGEADRLHAKYAKALEALSVE